MLKQTGGLPNPPVFLSLLKKRAGKQPALQQELEVDDFHLGDGLDLAQGAQDGLRRHGIEVDE